MYDIYEVPMYHDGTFNRGGEFNRIVSFTSEQTGRTYPLKRLEPESYLEFDYLMRHNPDFLKHLYAENMTIVHEISGDVDDEGFCTAAWLDGKPLSDYKLSDDFRLSINDVVEQEHMNS